MYPTHIEFNGIKYSRHKDNGYYCRGKWYKTGETMLHRAIWAAANGPIPSGHHIHHVDGNHENNDLSNLEAISASDHAKHHAKDNSWVGSKENLEQLAKVNDLAKAWHASPEGLEWHSKNGKETWIDRKVFPVPCNGPECSVIMMTPFPTRAKYCCRSCKGRAATAAKGGVFRKPYKKSNEQEKS